MAEDEEKKPEKIRPTQAAVNPRPRELSGLGRASLAAWAVRSPGRVSLAAWAAQPRPHDLGCASPRPHELFLSLSLI